MNLLSERIQGIHMILQDLPAIRSASAGPF